MSEMCVPSGDTPGPHSTAGQSSRYQETGIAVTLTSTSFSLTGTSEQHGANTVPRIEAGIGALA